MPAALLGRAAISALRLCRQRSPSSPNPRFCRVVCSESAVGQPMEVEIKLRLPNAEAHKKVAEIFASSHKVTHNQENIFFDGAQKELSSKLAILRLRFYNDKTCLITMKKKTVLKDGVGRSEELEAPLDLAVGRACVEHPKKLKETNVDLLNQLVDEYKVADFICLGGFKNIRGTYDWQGHTIELDETKFDHGTVYEIECETDKPEELKKELEDLLKHNGVEYHYSSSTKFANFINKTVL